MPARLIGVGVGPGDPSHLTLGALAAIRQADRVVAPCPAREVEGRAEAIVRHAAPDLTVDRLPYEMATGSGVRAATAEAAADRIVAWLDAGEAVAFVTLGDPNVYSTFSSVAAAVRARRPDMPIVTVPGITAFQDLAARSGTVLLDGTESLTLVTALDGAGAAKDALADRQRALVVYKGGRYLPELLDVLAATGRMEGAVVGELLGMDGEDVGPAVDRVGRPAGYLATVIVPPAGRPR